MMRIETNNFARSILVNKEGSLAGSEGGPITLWNPRLASSRGEFWGMEVTQKLN